MLELASSHRQLAGTLAAGRVSSWGTSVPHPLGRCILVCGCWGSQMRVQAWWVRRHRRRPLHPQTRSGTGPACTSLSASPILGQCTQPLVLKRGPLRLALSCPLPGPSWPGAEHGVGWAAPRCSAGRGQEHRSALCPSAGPLGTETCHHPLSQPQGHPEVPWCLGLGCSPGKSSLPHPCPAGSPQPSLAVLQSGLGRWAGSRGCHAVSPAWGRSHHPQHGGSCGSPLPLHLPSRWQVPWARLPTRQLTMSSFY